MDETQLSSPLCALAAQSEGIQFRRKVQTHDECDDRSPGPASQLKGACDEAAAMKQKEMEMHLV